MPKKELWIRIFSISILIVLGVIVFLAVVGPIISPPSININATLEADRADCSVSFQAKAWLDQNRNGKWDESEQPLPNIKVTFNGLRVSAVTDADGTADLFFLRSCFRTPEAGVAEAVAPINFVATTPTQLPYSPEIYTDANAIPQFGFAPVETTTP